jgi:hypothetical protein
MNFTELESERANAITLVLSGWFADGRRNLDHSFPRDLAVAESRVEGAREACAGDGRLRELQGRVDTLLTDGVAAAHRVAQADLSAFAGTDPDMPDATSMSSAAVRVAAGRRMDALARTSPAAWSPADRALILEQLTAGR